MAPRDTETPGRPAGRPPSGGPAISARSRSNSAHLGWCDGQWSGTPAKVAVARAYSGDGAPLDLVPGFRPITPDDGALLYAAAVIGRVLGPADWADPLPDGALDELLGDLPEGAVA